MTKPLASYICRRYSLITTTNSAWWRRKNTPMCLPCNYRLTFVLCIFFTSIRKFTYAGSTPRFWDNYLFSILLYLPWCIDVVKQCFDPEMKHFCYKNNLIKVKTAWHWYDMLCWLYRICYAKSYIKILLFPTNNIKDFSIVLKFVLNIFSEKWESSL